MEEGKDIDIKVHLWRAEMLTGVVELDKDGIIQKAGCCALHQPGKCHALMSYGFTSRYLKTRSVSIHTFDITTSTAYYS